MTAHVRYNSVYQLQTNNSPDSYQNKLAPLDISLRGNNGSREIVRVGQNLADTYFAVLAGDKPLSLAGDIPAALGEPRQFTLQITRHV